MAKEILRELSDDRNQYLAGNAINNNAKERFKVELDAGKDDRNNSKDDENDTDAELNVP